MVNPSGTAAKEVSSTAAEKHWRDASAQVADEAGASQSRKESAELEFDITYVQTNVDACKALHRALSNLRSVLLGCCSICWGLVTFAVMMLWRVFLCSCPVAVYAPDPRWTCRSNNHEEVPEANTCMHCFQKGLLKSLLTLHVYHVMKMQ